MSMTNSQPSGPPGGDVSSRPRRHRRQSRPDDVGGLQWRDGHGWYDGGVRVRPRRIWPWAYAGVCWVSRGRRYGAATPPDPPGSHPSGLTPSGGMI